MKARGERPRDRDCRAHRVGRTRFARRENGGEASFAGWSGTHGVPSLLRGETQAHQPRALPWQAQRGRRAMPTDVQRVSVGGRRCPQKGQRAMVCSPLMLGEPWKETKAN